MAKPMQSGPQQISGQTLQAPDEIPEFLVDGIFGVAVVNEVARLTLFSMRNNIPSGDVQPAAVCRLAIPISMIPQISKFFEGLVSQIQSAVNAQSKAEDAHENTGVS